MEFFFCLYFLRYKLTALGQLARFRGKRGWRHVQHLWRRVHPINVISNVLHGAPLTLTRNTMCKSQQGRGKALQTVIRVIIPVDLTPSDLLGILLYRRTRIWRSKGSPSSLSRELPTISMSPWLPQLLAIALVLQDGVYVQKIKERAPHCHHSWLH